MFAKLYETTEHGQILVMLDSTEEGEPFIKYSCQPEGLGVCSAQSPTFENSENLCVKLDRCNCRNLN